MKNEEETEDPPSTIDVVGNTELDDGALASNKDDEDAPLYPDVLDHSLLLLVNGISLRKNPCDGSSNLMSKPLA